jgi:hypothetical protein
VPAGAIHYRTDQEDTYPEATGAQLRLAQVLQQLIGQPRRSRSFLAQLPFARWVSTSRFFLEQ